MNRVITHTSTYADNILCQCSSGIVHSVYNKTINIQTEGQLLALQSAASPLSPVSLVTNLEQEDLASPASPCVCRVKLWRSRPADSYPSSLTGLYTSIVPGLSRYLPALLPPHFTVRSAWPSKARTTVGSVCCFPLLPGRQLQMI